MFADFRIANSQGTAVSRLPTKKLTTTLSKIILRVHDKAQSQQSSTAENWLAGPEKNTDSADGTVPPFRGIRRIADSQRESTGISRTFIFFETAVPLATAHNDRRHQPRCKPPSGTDNSIRTFAPFEIALTS